MTTEEIHKTITDLYNENQLPIPLETICRVCNISQALLSSHLRILETFRRIKFTNGNKSVMPVTDE